MKNKTFNLSNKEVLKGIDGAILDIEGEYLAYIASLVPDNGVVVELGSHKGKSTCYIGSALKQSGKKNVSLHCVDLWTIGDINKQYSTLRPNRPYGEMYHSQGAYNLFNSQTKRLGISDLIVPHIIDTVELSKTWEIPIDFLFIDADHLYEGVHADWENWNGFVKKGGYVSFHDYNNEWEGVQRVVDTEVDYSEWKKVDVIMSLCTIKKKLK
jgi:predicted O-methyltransferase YrrM